jgi:hypothetical protein
MPPRAAGANPNFDPARFVASSDTIYIIALAHKQALSAPARRRLLEQIRHATYERHTAHARSGEHQPPVVLWLAALLRVISWEGT